MVFSCAALGRLCDGEAGDAGLRGDGCAILGAGDCADWWVGFVGDDSVMIAVLARPKKKQCSMELYARASWGAALLRPYTEFGVGGAVGADHAGEWR